MKALIGALALLVSSTVSAQTFPTPDFEMIRSYEISVIAKDTAVRQYAGKLGGTSFSVNNGKPALDMYEVVTNNGCKFDVKVVYKTWPGIDALVISKSQNCR